MATLVIILLIVGGVGMYLLRERMRKGPRRRREAALREVAARLGFTYEPQRDPFADGFLDRGLIETLPQFSRAFYGFPHVLQGDSAAGPVRIFDVWHAGWGDGKTYASSPIKLTVAGFQLDGARLPRLHVYPKTRVTKASDTIFKYSTDVLGKKWRDIDFTNHRVFSDRYSLRSIDEDAARRLFAPRFIEFWEALPPEDSWAAASCAGSLVVYRQAPWSAGREQEIDPADTEAFLHGAERIALAFHDASTETPPG